MVLSWHFIPGWQGIFGHSNDPSARPQTGFCFFDFGPREWSQRLGNGRGMPRGPFSRSSDESGPILDHFRLPWSPKAILQVTTHWCPLTWVLQDIWLAMPDLQRRGKSNCSQWQLAGSPVLGSQHLCVALAGEPNACTETRLGMQTLEHTQTPVCVDALRGVDCAPTIRACAHCI